MHEHALGPEAIAEMLGGSVGGVSADQVRRWLTYGQEPSAQPAIKLYLELRSRGVSGPGPQIGEAHTLQDDYDELLKSVEDGEPLTPQESAICLPILRALLQILRSEAPGRLTHVANQLAFLIDNKKAATDHPQIAEALNAIDRFKPRPSSARPRPAVANKRRRRQ